MNSKLKIEVLDYLLERYGKVNDLINSTYLNMYAKKMGKLFPLMNSELINEKNKLIELIDELEKI